MRIILHSDDIKNKDRELEAVDDYYLNSDRWLYVNYEDDSRAFIRITDDINEITIHDK